MLSSDMLAPSLHDLALFYGAAAVPIVFLMVAVVYLWRAWARERVRNRAMVDRMTETLTAGAGALADANSYLRDLRDQGIRAVTREPPS